LLHICCRAWHVNSARPLFYRLSGKVLALDDDPFNYLKKSPFVSFIYYRLLCFLCSVSCMLFSICIIILYLKFGI